MTTSQPSIGVILPAAGSSSRFGGAISKVFLTLQDREVWQWSADVFLEIDGVKSVVVVVSPSEIESFRDRHSDKLCDRRLSVVAGADCRSKSVRNGLNALPIEIDFVAVHDAARPLITVAAMQQFFQTAVTHTACIPAIPVTSTVKRVKPSGLIDATLDRSELRLAQTPQVVAKETLVEAYKATNDPSDFTDEASMIEATGQSVFAAEGWPENIKLTTQSDLNFAMMILNSRANG